MTALEAIELIYNDCQGPSVRVKTFREGVLWTLQQLGIEVRSYFDGKVISISRGGGGCEIEVC